MYRAHLDFETRSVVDIRRAGGYLYATHPSTDVLCAGYAFNDGPVRLWTRGSAPPADLLELARDRRVGFHAFNAAFERRIWHDVCHRRYGWPDIPLDRWYDTQADAYACALPGDLKRCAQALNLDVQKDAAGTRLINKLCLPIGDSEEFRSRGQFPDDFFALYEYCRQDVLVEREIYHTLPVHTTAAGPERELWMLTEQINDRGVYVDRVFAKAIWTIIEVELKDRVNERLLALTQGRVVSGNETARINQELLYPLGDFQKATLLKALTCPLLDDRDRELIECRLAFANTSVAKFARMLEMVGPDDRVRDLLQYHGAATGRYAGRGIQVQNFPRQAHKDADQVARAVVDPLNTLDTLEENYGPIQDLAKAMLRPSLCSPRGKKLVCRDYSSIEARGTAWTARDMDQLAAFAAGRDIYRVTASDMYGVPYEDIGKDSAERQAGKIAVLACGYQGGWKALRDFAAGYGVHWTPHEADRIVKDFRAARPKLVAAWQEFENAAMNALSRPGHEVLIGNCSFGVFEQRGAHMSLTLPSRRQLWFPFARIELVTLRYETPDGEIRLLEKEGFTHMWMNHQHQWVRRGLHGGSLFQSYVQAICRDIMTDGMLRQAECGWEIVLSVHDEIVAEAALDRDPANFEALMIQPPAWATDFPIGASGWEGPRYRK